MKIAESRGFTLVELMITVAVLVTIVGIAIPLYQGYLREGHYAAMRTTINQLRTPIEDRRLEDGGYGATGTLPGFAAISARFPLDPDIDFAPYDYSVEVVSATNFHLVGRFNDDIWVRCEDRANSCCSENSANDPAAACD
jgi:prepilin-type N-terminal cleavage/methylation domain-containing protein